MFVVLVLLVVVVFPVLVVLWLPVMWLLDVLDMVAVCVSQAEREKAPDIPFVLLIL